jgi:hypothetical protein
MNTDAYVFFVLIVVLWDRYRHCRTYSQARKKRCDALGCAIHGAYSTNGFHDLPTFTNCIDCIYVNDTTSNCKYTSFG